MIMVKLAFFDQTNLMPADDAQLKLYDWQRLSKLKRCTFSDAIKKKRARDKETVLCESLDGLKISKKKDECLTSAMKKLCLSPVPVPVPAAMCQAKTTSDEFKSCVPLDSQDIGNNMKQEDHDQPTQDAAFSCGNGEVLPVPVPSSLKRS